MKTNDRNIPDFVLERFVLKELPDRQLKKIHVLMQENKDVLTRIEGIRSSNQTLVKEYPVDVMATSIRAKYNDRKQRQKIKSRYRRPFVFKLLLPSLAGATTAVILLLFVFPLFNNDITFDPFSSMAGNTTRIKGDDSKLYIYRKTGSNIELMKNGSVTYEHDLLQLAYRSNTHTYGIIFSIDGRGVVTLHYPADTTASSKIQTNNKVLINQSYELDDAPQFERFFFVTSKNKPDIDAILKQAYLISYSNKRILSEDLKLSKDYHQYSLILYKGKKP